MPKVTFIQPDGSRQTLDVATGTSVMQASVSNGLPGIIGECGGAAMCATCHCYVDSEFADKLAPVTAVEDEMLECVASPRLGNSRLGCQILVTEAIDGLVVALPEREV